MTDLQTIERPDTSDRLEAKPRTSGAIGALATRCLLLELQTWPKPGLVSLVDSGSHDDMDAALLTRSAETLTPFFVALAEAGRAEADMDILRSIGLDAERHMLAATGGINTHRGAIFGLGLLCAAAGRRQSSAHALGPSLGRLVRATWGAPILAAPMVPDSHGAQAFRQHGAIGARGEAAAGFPNVYTIGVPALRKGAKLAPGDPEAARVQAIFALIARIDDTNLLHRGGPTGLVYAQAAANAFLQAGGVGQLKWREAARHVHEGFVARRLSPGGAADLLALSLFVDQLDG